MGGRAARAGAVSRPDLLLVSVSAHAAGAGAEAVRCYVGHPDGAEVVFAHPPPRNMEWIGITYYFAHTFTASFFAIGLGLGSFVEGNTSLCSLRGERERVSVSVI